MMNVDNYVYSIIGVEVMSVLVCLVILYGNVIEQHEKTRRNQLFSWNVASCMLALVADTVSWIFDGRGDLSLLLYVCTTISLVMTFVIDILFIFYITAYTREGQKVSYLLARIFLIFASTAILVIIVSSGTGWLFSLENGVYQEGPYYTWYLIVNLCCTIFCLATNMYFMRYLNLHDRIASMSYIAIPLVAGCINLFVEEFSYAYPSIALAMALLYVMMQSERQDKLEEAGHISYYAARHDVLTGLLNRMAYEEKLSEISRQEGQAGAIFTDVNGLKYANDNFGHEAGDRLLTRYAELLCSKFRKEEVYRISGDEFVILMDNVDENVVLARLSKLKETMAADEIPMACTGLAYGNRRDINALVKRAESEMYLEKAEFHEKHPEMTRR